MARANDAASSPSATRPNPPDSSMIQGTPPDRRAATGSPVRIASAAATPNVSDRLGWTKTAARAIACATRSRGIHPSKATASCSPSARASSSQRTRSPAARSVPTSRRRRLGRRASSSANARMRTSMPLCSPSEPTQRSRPGSRPAGSPIGNRRSGTGFGSTPRAPTATPRRAATRPDSEGLTPSSRTPGPSSRWYRSSATGSASASSIVLMCSVTTTGIPRFQPTSRAAIPSGSPVWA